jgi:hypothetical protein
MYDIPVENIPGLVSVLKNMVKEKGNYIKKLSKERENEEQNATQNQTDAVHAE